MNVSKHECYIHEPGKNVSLVMRADVVVCGSGPAGIAAALAAARSGANTVLLEMHGCLGGVWTSGMLSWVIDPDEKGSIMEEITTALQQRGAHALSGSRTSNFAYDVEEMKLLLEELAVGAGVRVRLHTWVVAAECRDGRIDAVLTESASGREAWQAKCFIDATGDGTLAALAGCGFDMGSQETGEFQPMSLMALLTGVNAKDIPQLIGGGLSRPKELLYEAFREAGVSPSYTRPILFRIRDDLFAFIGNHEYGVRCDDADGITEATLRARAEVHILINALRASGHPWNELRIVATAPQIGIREGRRVRGLYTVRESDLLEGVRHPDAVCRVNFGIDVHSVNKSNGGSYEAVNRKKTLPYDIPLRALIAKDINGMMMAGRCISGDFLAHASYRVTGCAVAMGQAAGVTAALAALTDRLPQQIPFAEVAEANRVLRHVRKSDS